jgi:hypothetical protein
MLDKYQHESLHQNFVLRSVLLSLVKLSVNREELASKRELLFSRCEPFEVQIRQRRLASVMYLDALDAPPHVQMERWLWGVQKAHLLEFLQRCKNQLADVLVIKGAEISERFFDSQPVGRKGDLDVLIEKHDEEIVRSVLHDMGFIQGSLDTESMQLIPCSAKEISMHEAGGYNLKSFVKTLDVTDKKISDWVRGKRYPLFHYGGRCIALIVIDMIPILNRRIPSSFPYASTISLEDHLWYLCSHFYLKTFFNKGAVKLSLLCEVSAILRNTHTTLDWNYLIEISKKYDFYPYIFYTISFLNSLLGLNLDKRLLYMFDPRHGSRLRDYGWIINRAFDELDEYPFLLMNDII